MSKLHWTPIWGTVLLSQCNSNPRWAPMFRRTRQCGQYPWSGRTKSLSNGAEATKTRTNLESQERLFVRSFICQKSATVAQNTWTLWLSGKLVLLRYVNSTYIDLRTKLQLRHLPRLFRPPTKDQDLEFLATQKTLSTLSENSGVFPPNHPISIG